MAVLLCSLTAKEHNQTVNKTVREHNQTVNKTVKEHDKTVNKTVKEHNKTVNKTVKEHNKTVKVSNLREGGKEAGGDDCLNVLIVRQRTQ